jgi:membrane-associated phospholipid phosphatase
LPTFAADDIGVGRGDSVNGGFGDERSRQPAHARYDRDEARPAREPLFTASDAWIAASFVAGTIAMYPVDRRLARSIQRDPLQDNSDLERTATFFRKMGTPFSMYIGGGMYAIGRLARIERMADLGLHGTEALLIARHTNDLVKWAAGRARPQLDIEDERNFRLGRGYGADREEYRSFPSGHAAMGFAAAAAVTAETAKWWPGSQWYIGPAMFGGAVLIGVSRMYDNRHWASDVVMGAAIGTFTGLKVVRYHHSHPGNRIDRWLLAATPVPTGDGGLALVWSVNVR